MWLVHWFYPLVQLRAYQKSKAYHESVYGRQKMFKYLQKCPHQRHPPSLAQFAWIN